jgi:hypothetical protein
MTTVAALPQIITTQSAVKAFLACNRRRWLEYEALNDKGTRGWERKKLSLPLATGSGAHRFVEALLLGVDVATAVQEAKDEYIAQAIARGVEGEADTQENKLVQEQGALIEALGWGWARVRLPKLLAEYDVIDVEREEFTALSDDVGLASRSDAVLRRKSDGRLFVYNPKTVSNPSDARWQLQWEVDMQLMTETLAVERRLGESIYGVLIEGFDKGIRVQEKNELGEKIGYRQSSPLIYGYKCEANPPLVPQTIYDFEYTRKKGWRRFPVWEEKFGHAANLDYSPIAYWVNWLPVELIEAQFVPLPPIMRDERAVESVVTQIVAIEEQVRTRRDAVENISGDNTRALDLAFPQNFHSCLYPSRCGMFDLCHTSGVGDDPAGSGLYQARESNHPVGGGVE